LNFFIPGAGHLYASGGERWVLFVMNIICAISVPVVYVTFIGNLIIWIVAMVGSRGITDEYNQRLEAPVRAALDEKAINEDRVVGADVARQLAKIHETQIAGLIDALEAQRLRTDTLSKASGGWSSEGMIEFLSPFAALTKSGAISESDLAEIKRTYTLLKKGRPAA
jgi:hypothetical protein